MVAFTAKATGDEVVKAFAGEAVGKTCASKPTFMIGLYPTPRQLEIPISLVSHAVLITGPSEGGVGSQTAIFLAAGKPKEIILAGRNRNKIQPVIQHIQESHPNVKTTFVQLDLADLSSVRKAAKEIGEKIEKLDALINNAGSEWAFSAFLVRRGQPVLIRMLVMAVKDYETTKDGIEMQFGANHVGHFLLTNLLMPKLIAAGGGARVVNVSSFGYLAGGVRFNDPNFQVSKPQLLSRRSA